MKKNGKGRLATVAAAVISLMIVINPAVYAISMPQLQSNQLSSGQTKTLIPVGRTVGLKIYADGIMIVDISKVTTQSGEEQPASDAGLIKGDIIKKVNGKEVLSAKVFASMIAESGGQAVELIVQRSGGDLTVTVTPVKSSADGAYKTGMLVRDSIAGIGTITFYDPETGVYGALGHGINDTETGQLVPISGGEIVGGKVTGILPGEKGTPGMLKGEFSPQAPLGTIYANTSKGVFGVLGGDCASSLSKELEVATAGQIHVGQATILSNVQSDQVVEFTIEIESVFPDADQRNMLIKVTDQRLLELTGGIVQGMSGSPIIQDGRLVGAVTHVLINDPTSGYGIFAENMLFEGFSSYQENAA